MPRARRELSSRSLAPPASRGVRATTKNDWTLQRVHSGQGSRARGTHSRATLCRCTRVEFALGARPGRFKDQFILHTVLYMLQYLTLSTYFRLYIIHAARRAGVVRDVASGRSETWDEMRVSHDRAGHAHGTRSRRDECGRLTTPTAGLRGGMAHGSWRMAHGGCGAPIGIGAPTRAAAAWPLRRTAPIPPRAAHTPARV